MDDEELAAFIGRDDWLPMITDSAVSKVASGLNLKLSPGKNWKWVAMIIRRALAMTIPHPNEGPNRPTNAEVRDEILRRARLIQKSWKDLVSYESNNGLDDNVDSLIFAYSAHHWTDEKAFAIESGTPPLFSRYRRALAEMDWLGGYLERISKSVKRQSGPWKQSKERSLRLERAELLAEIFHSAFGTRPTANNWAPGGGDARHVNPTPFMSFYQAIVSIAFNEHSTPNLSEILKIACYRHREKRPELNERIFPGLGGA